MPDEVSHVVDEDFEHFFDVCSEEFLDVAWHWDMELSASGLWRRLRAPCFEAHDSQSQ